MTVSFVAEDDSAMKLRYQQLLTARSHAYTTTRTMARQNRITPQLRDEIVDAVEHDLRIPVANILGFVDLLRDGGDTAFTDEQLEFLSRIEANCQTLLEMFERLRSLSRTQ